MYSAMRSADPRKHWFFTCNEPGIYSTFTAKNCTPLPCFILLSRFTSVHSVSSKSVALMFLPRSHKHVSTHMCVYIYIYICCEVIIWAKFGHFRCYYLGQVGVIIWAKLFLAYKIGVSSDFWHTQLSFCVFFVPNYLAVI